MKLNYRIVCFIWGALDIFYIIRFAWLNVEQGRIPLVDDIISFNHINSEYGSEFWTVLMFSVSLILNISIIISAILLLVGWCRVHCFIYIQIPFRLLMAIPSISFLPWLLKQLNITSVSIFVILLVLSEIIKFASFKLASNKKNEGTSYGE